VCLGERLDLLKFLHDAPMALMLARAGKVGLRLSCRTTSAHEPQKQTTKAKHTLVLAGAAAMIRAGLLDATCE
jgi:hypothetical protein